MFVITHVRPHCMMVTYIRMSTYNAGNAASMNKAPALKLADLAEVAFSLKPCTFFQTHIHVRFRARAIDAAKERACVRACGRACVRAHTIIIVRSPVANVQTHRFEFRQDACTQAGMRVDSFTYVLIMYERHDCVFPDHD